MDWTALTLHMLNFSACKSAFCPLGLVSVSFKLAMDESSVIVIFSDSDSEIITTDGDLTFTPTKFKR